MGIAKLGALLAVFVVTGCGPYVVKTGPESCELAKEEVSEFDGKVRQNIFYYDGDFRGVGLTRSKDGDSLLVLWASPGLVNSEIPAGADIELAFGDGKKLVLTTDKAAPLVGGTSNDPVTDYSSFFSQWVTVLKLNPEQLEQFASSPLTAMRTTAGPGMFQKALPDVQGRLQTLAICFTRHSK
jgi:hypothetical protein